MEGPWDTRYWHCRSSVQTSGALPCDLIRVTANFMNSVITATMSAEHLALTTDVLLAWQQELLTQQLCTYLPPVLRQPLWVRHSARERIVSSSSLLAEPAFIRVEPVIASGYEERKRDD